jgi:hypothetical protein
MEYRQVKISQKKTYSMAYTKLQICGNKDQIMKMPYVSGVSSADIILSNVTNLRDANYVWVMDMVKINVATPTNTVRLPFHVKFIQTTPGFIMPVIHEEPSIIIWFS